MSAGLPGVWQLGLFAAARGGGRRDGESRKARIAPAERSGARGERGNGRPQAELDGFRVLECR